MECLLKFIKCKKCDKVLEKPVILPCGNFICEKHQYEDREENNSIYCPICDVNHEIPPNKGFIRVLPLDQLIEKNIECIDLGNEHQWAFEQIKRFSDLFEKFEKFNSNLGLVIHDKISELKAKVDLRREELKNQIDEEALALIKQLDNYEVECKEKIVTIKADTILKLNLWKEDLNLWREKMNNFKKDTKMWENINKEATDKYEQMNLSFSEVRKSVFLNQLYGYENLQVSIGRDLK